ncbi:MAG: anhydro-N-acetylmuramic acid kinase, partial [Betaproteobacteria bacterium]
MSEGRLFIGLMSGTSLDGIDGVLVDLATAGRPLAVLAHAHAPFAAALRSELLALNTPGADELARAALAANALARANAGVVGRLLAQAGVDRKSVRAIGSHGQTVRHRPGAVDGIGYTLQLDNPALLAELTGIDVAADFRRRDLAAGGQGAPLVPAFHREVFARAGETVVVLNLGGVANLSVLAPTATTGFDCGPGNALLDHWCERHTGAPFDDGGRWAASGRVVEPLLAGLKAEPYLALPPPKSTGRDLFNPGWLASRLTAHAAARPEDVQATLAEFSARCVADAVDRHAPAAVRVVVCGGGACNEDLLRRLSAALPGRAIVTSAACGLPPLQVEAAAFAWLAARCIAREPGNLPSVTGAAGP